MEPDPHVSSLLFVVACHVAALLACSLGWRHNRRLAVAAGLAVTLLTPAVVTVFAERAQLRAEWREIQVRIESGELRGPEYPNPFLGSRPPSLWQRIASLLAVFGLLAWIAALVLVIHELCTLRPVRAGPVVVVGTILLRLGFGMVL